MDVITKIDGTQERDMGRLRKIIQRYGWQFPFTVLAIAAIRLARIYRRVYSSRLRLTTRGPKGRHVSIGPNVSVSPGCWLDLEDGVTIEGRGVFEISVKPQARVRIGAGTWISHDCHVFSYNQIDVGANVLIGEFVSIRDSTHGYADSQVPIKEQNAIIGSITISDDVWIGRGSLIQGKPEGVVIGYGAIIAANSVVSRSIPTMEIWGGAPARFIRRRGEEQLEQSKADSHCGDEPLVSGRSEHGAGSLP